MEYIYIITINLNGADLKMLKYFITKFNLDLFISVLKLG